MDRASQISAQHRSISSSDHDPSERFGTRGTCRRHSARFRHVADGVPRLERCAETSSASDIQLLEDATDAGCARGNVYEGHQQTNWQDMQRFASWSTMINGAAGF